MDGEFSSSIEFSSVDGGEVVTGNRELPNFIS